MNRSFLDVAAFKDPGSLGLPAAGCEPKVTLCPPSAVAYSTPARTTGRGGEPAA